MSWQTTVTDKGLAILADVDNHVINIVSASAGTGTVPAELLGQQTALVNPMQNLILLKDGNTENQTRLRMRLYNDDLTAAYMLNQIGIFVTVDGGDPILWYIAQNDVGDDIPSPLDVQGFLSEYTSTLIFNMRQDVTVEVPESVYVTSDQLESQIVSMTVDFDEPTAPAALESGELLSSLIGKIAALMTDYFVKSTVWDAKYDKPLTGIPLTDLSSNIQDIIPNQASAENPLTTQDFVNSSINQMAAHRVTYDADGNPFPTRASLLSAATVYHEGTTYTPTEHDYAIITADESAPAPFTGGQSRFEYDGVGWGYAYGINDKPFTAAETAAISSGITAALVTQFKTAATQAANALPATSQAVDSAKLGGQLPAYYAAASALASYMAKPPSATQNNIAVFDANKTPVDSGKKVADFIGSGNGTVTNAHLADMAASTVKGRNTQSTGDPENITMPQLNDLLSKASVTAKATPADGDSIIYTDSAANYAAKRMTWANIKTFLSSLFSFKDVKYTATFTAAGWTGSAGNYRQTVTVTGMTAADEPVVDVVDASTTSVDMNYRVEADCIKKMYTGANNVTAVAIRKPTVNVTYKFKVSR